MGMIKSRFLLFYCVTSLLWPAGILKASTNAQPWGEQEAERNAQEEITFAERSAQEEMSSSIYGRITSIDQNAHVLSLLATDDVENKEEEEDDEDVSQDYHFKSNTPVTGLDSPDQLSAGDYVTLDYYTFRDRNRVTSISFDKHEENESPESKLSSHSSEVLVG